MLGIARSAGGVGVLLIACSMAMAQPPGGFPTGPVGLPQPGQIMPAFLQEQLKLTAEQKKQLEELQKEVDAKLEKILTTEQKKSLSEMRVPFGGFGGPGPGGFGGPGGPGGPGGGFGPPGGFGGPGGGFGGPGGFGMPRNDDVKKKLGATDEEWKVIGPKLQKILTSRQILTADARAVSLPVDAAARTEVRLGDPAAGGGPRPGGGFGSPAGSDIISQAQAEFRAVLDDPKHTKAELQEKVEAVRKARQQVRKDLTAAQKDLLQMLTADQEAILVGLGYIE